MKCVGGLFSIDLLLKFRTPACLPGKLVCFQIDVKQAAFFRGAAVRDSLPTENGSKAVFIVSPARLTATGTHINNCGVLGIAVRVPEVA